MFWIIALIFLLYIRTINYNYVIDDYIRREGYLYQIPAEGASYEFFKRRPPRIYRLFMIGMHCVNASIIYYLWGWAPALLFAVHPMSVWAVAWVTGNYYGTTAYFTLISYVILRNFPNAIGALAAMSIYGAALNSTIDAITFPFFVLLTGNPWGAALFVPLIAFFNGKRFKTGYKIRATMLKVANIDTSFHPKRLVLMTKLMGKYLYSIFVPDKIGLFTKYGDRIQDHPDRYQKMISMNGEFWSSLALCLTVFGFGLIIHPVGTLWFFVFMAVHSQFRIMGQFYAQRYLYLPMIGICVLVGTVLQHYPIALTAVVTFLVIRTHLFIPAWQNMEALYRHDIEMYPDNPHTYNNLLNYILGRYDMAELPALAKAESVLIANKALMIAPNDHEIHMNVAALYNAVGQIYLTLYHTKRAIECLPNKKHPNYQKLLYQRSRIEERIAKLQKQGRLGTQEGSLSRPPDTGKKEEEHGTRKKEGREEDTESVGNSEHRGRERPAEVGVG